MAIDNQFGKGIGVAAGFDLGAQKPLDARVAVNTIAERDAHVSSNRAYEGMLVFVDETKLTYQLVNGEWKEFGFNQADFEESFADAIEETNNRLETLEELVVGGEGEGIQAVIADVAANKAAIDKLNGAADAEGSVAKAVKDAVDAEAGLREEADEALGERIAAIEESIGEGGDVEKRIDQLEADVDAAQQQADKGVADAAAEKLRAEGKEAELLAAINKEIEDRGNAIDGLAERHDQEMDAVEGRVEALENLHKGDNSVENQIANAKQEVMDALADEQERAEGQEAAIRQEMADEAARVDQKIADDIAAESALRVAEEGKIRQELANEKAALQKEIDDDVAAEAALREAADNKVREDFAAADADILAQAKAHAEAEDVKVKNAQAEVDQAQNERIAALEGKFNGADGEQSVDAKIAAAKAEAIAAAEAKDAADRQAQATLDSAQGNRIDALEAKFEGEDSVDAKIQAVQQNLDDFEDAQETAHQALVGKDNELDAAIKAEASRADAAEKANAAAIAKEVEDREAQDAATLQAAKDYADQILEDADVAGAINEAMVGMQAAVDGEAQARQAADNVLDTAVKAEEQARQNADNALAGRLDKIEGDGEGSIAAAEAAAKAYADQKIAEVNGAAANLEGRVKANEDKLVGLEKATVKAEIEAAQAAAEKHADDAITALVDSAPDAMNTLNELAKAINDNKGVYDAYIAEHAQAMAQQKADLQAEIDADVKAEADRAKAEEQDIRADFAAADAQVLADAKAAAAEDAAAKVKVEKERAEAAEAAIQKQINEGLITMAFDGDTEYDDLAPLA